jgi:pimeloyl-ACP methyl ester carboxylesterase
MTTDIFAIHGAFSSPRIFNYLKHNIGKGYRWHFLDYQNETSGLKDIITSIKPPKSAHIVGHSMGGLIALGLANQPWVQSITTIATPLGGVDVNLLQSYLSRSEFVKEISSNGEFIRHLNKMLINKPVQHLISAAGFSPWIYEPNDGVITLRSQRAMKFGEVHDVFANHAEIMLDDTTVSYLLDFWKK